MLIGTHYFDESEFKLYQEGNTFYQMEGDKRTDLSKAYLAEQIANYWSDDCIDEDMEEFEDGYKAIKILPIYDWITIELYGYGNTEKEARIDVEKRFKDFINYNENLETNIEKNKKRFMSRVKKFGYLPKDRKVLHPIHALDFPESEIVYFEDSDLDFRELAIENGVPADGRADGPIFGYVDGNKLVIFKKFFINNQKDLFFEFVENHYKEIAKHYGLKEYELFLQVIPYQRREVDENNVLLEDLVFKTFEYYVPGSRYGYFKIENKTK